jgi:hypothetical protein
MLNIHQNNPKILGVKVVATRKNYFLLDINVLKSCCKEKEN